MIYKVAWLKVKEVRRENGERQKSVTHFSLSQCWFKIVEGAESAETSLVTTMQCVGKVLSECSTRQFGLVHNR